MGPHNMMFQNFLPSTRAAESPMEAPTKFSVLLLYFTLALGLCFLSAHCADKKQRVHGSSACRSMKTKPDTLPDHTAFSHFGPANPVAQMQVAPAWERPASHPPAGSAGSKSAQLPRLAVGGAVSHRAATAK
jgi:hypothetical protein